MSQRRGLARPPGGADNGYGVRGEDSMATEFLDMGARLKARRLELGMSQRQLADRVGVSFQQIQRYERGAINIRSPRLQRLAAALDVSPVFFVEDDETMRALAARQHHPSA